jgi:hypothetical protein
VLRLKSATVWLLICSKITRNTVSVSGHTKMPKPSPARRSLAPRSAGRQRPQTTPSPPPYSSDRTPTMRRKLRGQTIARKRDRRIALP